MMGKTTCDARRGSTLMELSIVMAVVAVMSTMVVSFSILVKNRVQISSNEVIANEDFDRTKQLVRYWISANDNADFKFETDGENNIFAVSQIDGSRYTINVDDSAISAEYADGKTRSSENHYIVSLIFDLYTSSSGRQLIRCIVTYHMPNPAGNTRYTEKTASFLVAVRAGSVSR